ncbi:MAG: hypothetical protein OXF93_12410 [Acidobacteria bacterium]|nr:hypothetical protein [Acidobacteriota bacterium]
MQRRHGRAVAALTAAIALTAGVPFPGAASPPAAGRSVQAAAAPLYRCTDAARVEAGPVGLTLCDAGPTGELVERAERDNLQVRSGALVVTVAPGGVAAREGLLPNDMIFRVAGSDVDGGGPGATRLSDAGAASDTLVNFLRAGRPYRVKLRR